MVNYQNVDVLNTDWTSWQDMSPLAQRHILATALLQIAHEDENEEPMVTYILPAGTIAALETM